MTTQETILSVIPGTSETQRLVVVLRSLETNQRERQAALGLFDPESSSADRMTGPPPSQTFCEEVIAVRDRPVVLRQQSFSPAVGWFTQSELEMTQDQWSMMRCTVMPASKQIPARKRMPASGRSRRMDTSESQGFPGCSSDECCASVVPFSAKQAASA